MNDGWNEAGTSKAPVRQPERITIPAPSDNAQYRAITSQLQQLHKNLLRLENEGKLANTSDVPGLASEYQRKMRLNVNMLYAFLNQYIDVLSDLQKENAENWQALYVGKLKEPKGTPSAAKAHADAMSKVDNTTIDIVKNRINQIKNDYERYNGICISLQSTMKAENTERIMG